MVVSQEGKLPFRFGSCFVRDKGSFIWDDVECLWDADVLIKIHTVLFVMIAFHVEVFR